MFFRLFDHNLSVLLDVPGDRRCILAQREEMKASIICLGPAEAGKRVRTRMAAMAEAAGYGATVYVQRGPEELGASWWRMTIICTREGAGERQERAQRLPEVKIPPKQAKDKKARRK